MPNPNKNFILRDIPEGNHFTVDEVAKSLKMHPNSVRRLICQGKLETVRLFNRGRHLIPRAVLLRALGITDQEGR